MAYRHRRSPARWLAPIALVTCAVAVYAVVDHALQDDSRSSPGNTHRANPSPTGKQPQKGEKRRRYTVRSGDTLSGISLKTGVPLETIQRLNPKLDAQTLHAGQRIKLAP
jgi:LysM repeat protein